MYEFFKNIAEKNTCNSIGACSIHPSVNALYEFLFMQVREVSFYLVKLKEFGILNKEAMRFCIDILSIFLINSNFNQENYLNLFKAINKTKIEVKEKYVDYCLKNQLPCETINSFLEVNNEVTISCLIQKAQSYMANRQKGSDKRKQNFFELITCLARASAINIVKIKKFQSDFDKYDYEILRFFSLTNAYTIRNEKIKRRILEFSKIHYEINKTLLEILEKKYGKKETATVPVCPTKGYGILVSGDDFDELEALLKEIEQNKSASLINVYTNGSLFGAHFYPFFKNNRFLKGHLGSDNAEFDFSNFFGTILITQNFVQKIDGLYRGKIFSSKLISFEKVFDIKNKNYKPLIQDALNGSKFDKNVERRTIKINYDKNKVNQIVNEVKNDEIIIVVGKNNDSLPDFEEKKVVNFSCPLENDILFETLEKLIEKKVKITIFFSQCTLSILNVIFSLFNMELEMFFTPCSNILINPHVIEALKDEFGIKII